IPEGRLDVSEKRQVVLRRVLLTDQDLVFPPVPPSSPVLIGPAQAERKVDLGMGQELIDRLTEQALSAEPIVVVAEAMNAVKLRQFDRLPLGVEEPQIVEPELVSQVRLEVTGELG